MNRGSGRGGNDRTVGICMLIGTALGITYASVFGDASRVAYGLLLGSAVGLALHYFGKRS